LDDPSKEVKVVASDGRTGEQKDVTYTNCKVIGNGSFGIVFQARMVNVPKDLEDIAIKKVLQDKRFKVRYCSMLGAQSRDSIPYVAWNNRIESCRL
jgi:glycogen synthase kinase 3 beta